MWSPQHPSPPASQTPPRALPHPHLLCSLSTFSLGQGSGSPLCTGHSQFPPPAQPSSCTSNLLLPGLLPSGGWSAVFSTIISPMPSSSWQHCQPNTCNTGTRQPALSVPITAGIQQTCIEFLLCSRIKEAFLNKGNNKKEKNHKGRKESINSSVIKI